MEAKHEKMIGTLVVVEVGIDAALALAHSLQQYEC